MVKCYIGVGSNIGDRRSYIDRAIEELKRIDGVNFLRSSSIYETDPVGVKEQPKFLNGVLELAVNLDVRSLLGRLNAIEFKLGRRRKIKNGPRTIDLDILYFGDERICEDDIIVPHPKISEREFVLRGLRELGKA